jgi:predicted nucleic acid-binding protein
MPGVLIDTNLLVYLVDQNDPTRQARAQDILGQLTANHAGRISAQNLAEFMHVSMHRLHPPMPPAQALEYASRFARMWPVFDLTSQVVLEAARGVRDHHLSYYDAQIWASARLNQVPVIFSEDFQDGRVLEGVRFANPFVQGFEVARWL